jgi:hypothetical protein
VPAVNSDSDEISSYWAHTFDDELAEAFENYTLPKGVTADDLKEYGFSEESAVAAMSNIRFRAATELDAYQNYNECLASEGMEPADEYAKEPEQPGLFSRVGSAIMDFFKGT